MIQQTTIYEIVNKIAVNYKPQQIILFGSFAYGTPNDDSDLDLFILKETDKTPHERNIKVLEILHEIKVPVDVTVYTTKEYNQWKNVKHTLEYTIYTKGKIVFMENMPDDLVKLNRF